MARLASGSVTLPPTDYRAPYGTGPDEVEFAAMLDKSKSLDLDAGEIVGGMLRWQIADGYAWYVVTKDSPLTLRHVDYMDGWQVDPALIRGLRRQDVLAQLQQEKRIAAIFGRR